MPGSGRTAKQVPHATEKLRQLKRLGHVLVGARVEGQREVFPQRTCRQREDRDEIIDYVFKRYGKKHVALMGMYATFQYAAIIRASADDVVEQALAYVFSKDRDFQEFLKTPEARKVASTLRIRRSPASDAAEAPAWPNPPVEPELEADVKPPPLPPPL